MDLMKIGGFIAERRKAKGYTQTSLAEQLHITNRAVSKWECGRSMPDVSMIMELCALLEITVNELLCGEVITMENNNQKNEQLILDLAKEVERKNKTIWISMWIIMGISTIGFIGGTLLASMFLAEGPVLLAVILGLCVLFLLPCFYALKLEISVGAYKCKHCGHEIVPTYKEALRAMHMGTTRYLKCPNCQKRSWCKKILQRDK